jgi:hypothetical protein
MATMETFPYKLHAMLSRVSVDGSDEGAASVEWLPNGFSIINQEEFLKHIIPVYFNMTKMRSFTRQLNLWGFTRCVNVVSSRRFANPVCRYSPVG